MGTEEVRKVLKSFGLTEKETDVYMFLARQGARRTGEIAKGLRIHRTEIYRILKSLQDKNLVELTLEAPTRYSAVHLKTIIDSFIKKKRGEAASVETARRGLLADWNVISKYRPDPEVEKFTVVQGGNKIYEKIMRMVTETKNQFSASAPLPTLFHIDQLVSVEPVDYFSKLAAHYRFLVELDGQNNSDTKDLFKREAARGISLKVKTSKDQKLDPRMFIRDEAEALFFIKSSSEQDDTCLWTNCKSLILAFSAMFEDLWSKAAVLA